MFALFLNNHIYLSVGCVHTDTEQPLEPWNQIGQQQLCVRFHLLFATATVENPASVRHTVMSRK